VLNPKFAKNYFKYFNNNNMANSKSAEKRIEVNKRNRLVNRYYKSSVKTLIKMFFQDLETYKTSQDPEQKEKLKKNLNSIYSLIDKGTKKNVFHKNAAARKKSKLAAYLKIA
jgi:small subunit ribosomal protein S20